MYAFLEPSSALPLVQRAAIKKDAASQTEYYHQPMTHGRSVNCAQPGPSLCPNNSITADKPLSDYGVQFAREALQAGLQGSNKLMRSVAGFAYRQVMESEQLSLVCPGIKESLVFLAAMPSLAGAYPVSTRPACHDGASDCSMTYAHNNGPKEAATSYTPSFAYPVTNLTTTTESPPFYDNPAFALICMCGVFGLIVGSMIGFQHCNDVCSSYKLLKRENPEASHCQAIRAAFRYSGYHHGSQYRSPDNMIRLPVRPAQSAPVPTAPATCEQTTQTTCEQATQTELMVNETTLHEQPPPTYAEATALMGK